MIQPPKPTSQYQSEILAALTNTGITQTSPGGKARAFCDIVGNELGSLETKEYVNISQALLPYATGDSLDFLGQIYGMTRLPRADGTSDISEGNFQFYVISGTFGSINGGQNIVIPAGTRIFTSSATGPVFSTDQVTLLAASSSQSFSATSISAGASSNAPAGAFNRHNFSNYVNSAFGPLLVTNNFGLVGGRDVEDDNSFRFRINLKLQSTGGSSQSDLRLAVLQVPGVRDVVFSNEAGTYIAYIYGISPSIPPSLLQAVQSQLNKVTAYPIVGLAIAPDLIGISLTTSITMASGSTSSDLASAISSATTAAANYINNLGTNEELIINQISDKILNADPKIVDVGNPDMPIEEIFIWRSRADDTRYSRFLIDNYTPNLGERIVVENRTSAITITGS